MPEEVDALKSKVNHFQQKELINDILITGLPVNKEKSLLETVIQYIKIFDKELGSTQIEFAYRFKRNQSSSTNTNTLAPVIVRFTDFSTKHKLLQLQKRVGPILQNQVVGGDATSTNTAKVFSQQRLTPSNFELLQKARQTKQDLGYKFVWITESYNIFLQKDEKTGSIKVTSLNQLQQLHPTTSGSC